MARCNRCNKFLFLKTQTGYCDNCYSIVQEENRQKAEKERQQQEEAIRAKAKEELKRQEEEARQKAEEERKRQEEARKKVEEERKQQEEEVNMSKEEDEASTEKTLEQIYAEVERERQEEEKRKKAEEEKICKLFYMTVAEQKNIFALRARELVNEAQTRVDQGGFDDELVKMLQHTMAYADEDTPDWQKAEELFSIIKQRRFEDDEHRRKAEDDRIEQEKEKKANNMNKLHIGLIDTDGFYDSRDNLRNYTFIRMIDGYNKLMYWDESEEDLDADEIAQYDNENWCDDNEDEDDYKIIKDVFFHINDKGKGSIKTALDSIRCDQRWNVGQGIGVVFKISSSPRGKKAVHVITIEDALSKEENLKAIKDMVQSDINVYFFLMKQTPEVFERQLSDCTFEAAWKYKNLGESIELAGTNLELRSNTYSSQYYPFKTTTHYYFPSDTIILPNYISGKPVTNISASAFSNIGAEKIVIPESVSDIGEGAFEECSAREINVPNGVETIKAKTFANCSYLLELVLPPSVKSVSESAFLDCKAVVKRRLK